MIIVGTAHSHNAGYYQAYNTETGTNFESAIQTCSHCQCVLTLHKTTPDQVTWKEDGGFCGRCMKPICGPCADRMLTHGCEPFIQKLERQLEAACRRNQYRALAGV